MCVFCLLIVTWLWSVSLFNTNDMLLLTDDCPNDHIGLQSKCSILGSDGKMPCTVEHSAIWCYFSEEEAELKRHYFQETYCMYGCMFCRIPLAPWCHFSGVSKIEVKQTNGNSISIWAEQSLDSLSETLVDFASIFESSWWDRCPNVRRILYWDCGEFQFA